MASSRHAGHAGPCLSGRCASARHPGERTSTSRQTCCPLRFPRCAGSSGISSGQGRPIPVASSLGRTGDADTSSAPDDHTGPAEPELINPGCSTNEAARRLSVTPTAIRNRIKRGTLKTKPNGNHGRLVRVPLPVIPTVTLPVSLTGSDTVPGTVTRTVSDTVPLTLPDPLVPELRAQISL